MIWCPFGDKCMNFNETSCRQRPFHLVGSTILPRRHILLRALIVNGVAAAIPTVRAGERTNSVGVADADVAHRLSS